MNSIRLKIFTGAFALLLAAQVLLPGRSSAAKVIEQLPKPEWSYTLPEGQTFWGTIDSLQSSKRLFVPMVKTVTVSPAKTKSSGMLYASIDRVYGSNNWVYDYSDMANDKPFTAHRFFTASNGYSYFYKMWGGKPYDLTVVDPNGKRKWTKTITGSYSPVVLDNGNIVILTLVSGNVASRGITEYNQDGKEVRKLKLTGKWAAGMLEVLPNGYVVHTEYDKNKVSVYRSLGALTKPLAAYTAPKALSDPYFQVQLLSGGSFLIQMSSRDTWLLLGYDAGASRSGSVP